MADRSLLLGIGECMVELSDAGDGLMRRAFAGDVFNTLYYANPRLPDGWKSGFFTAVGQDPISDQMVDFMDQSGVGTDHIQRIPDRRPGLYMIHLTDGERSFSYWRENSAAKLLADDENYLKQAVLGAKMVFFSGITLAILPPNVQKSYFSALKMAKQQDVLVAFDPNIRPALWPDKQVIKEVIQRAADLADIILPGFDDEKAAFGDATPQETIDRYGGGQNGIVVLKNGPAEILVAGPDGIQKFATKKIAPVDSTGAGDSFNGAFLATYVGTEDIDASVRAGQNCAAEVIAHRGALIPR